MADVHQLFQKAMQLYQKGRIKDANKAYQKIVKQKPTFVDAINMYGITFAQAGDLPSAAKQFEKIIKLDAKKLTAYENLARVYMQMQAFAQAQNIYEQALKLDARSYVLNFGLGGALMSQNQLESALNYFTKAQVINAKDAMLFLNLGTVLSQLTRTNEAITAFNQAIKLDPKFAQASLRLGQLYIQNNDFIQAEKILSKAVQQEPNDYEINLCLADALQHNDKEEAAIERYYQADKLQPKSQNVYTKLDKLILHNGSEEKKVSLDSLSEAKVYKEFNDAINDAKKLASLTEYYDSTALATLIQFFETYEPEILQSQEWWQQQLEFFGEAKLGHDKLLRGIHSAVFSWSIPDEQTLSTIASFIDGTRLYSYGAGSALWEKLLSLHYNVEVQATDFQPRHSFLPIEVADYSKSLLPEGDTIFLAWIIRGDKGIFNLLEQFKPGQKLVLIGEPPDEYGVPRICATPEMFSLLKEEFTLNQTISLVNYSMLNDTVSLYIKN